MAFDPRLGVAFGFDADELAANREGRLTADQAVMLGNAPRAYARQRSRVWVLLVVVLIVVAVLAYLVMANTPGTSTGVVVAFAAGVGVILLVIVIAMGRSRRTMETLAASPLLQVEGPLRIRANASGWTATVGEARFELDAERMNALVEGERYRVNHLPFGGKVAVVSIERI